MTALEPGARREPVRLSGLPWIGPPSLLTDSVRFMLDTAKQGDVVHAKVFGLDFFLIYAPQAAEQVLIRNQKNYRKDLYLRRAERVFGNGLLRAEGDLWRQQRRLIQPSFHKQRVRGYAETMLALTARTLDALAPGTELDLHAVVSTLTAEIAVETMFGQSANVDAVGVDKQLGAIMARFEAPRVTWSSQTGGHLRASCATGARSGCSTVCWRATSRCGALRPATTC